MRLSINAVASAERVVAQMKKAVAEGAAALAAEKARRPDATDLNAQEAHEEAIEKLHRKLSVAQAGLKTAESRLEACTKEEEEAAFKAKHADLDRRNAAAARKDVPAIFDEFSRVRTALVALADLKKETDAVNAQARTRGLPAITHAEDRARRSPVVHHPARTEAQVVWRNARGEKAMCLRMNVRSGEMEPGEAGFTKRVEEVVVQHPRTTGGELPESLLTGLHLPGLFKHEVIWPPRS